MQSEHKEAEQIGGGGGTGQKEAWSTKTLRDRPANRLFKSEKNELRATKKKERHAESRNTEGEAAT